MTKTRRLEAFIPCIIFENANSKVWALRPKLKFYLFPLTPTDPEKRPYSKKFISIFSQEFIATQENCPM